MTAIVTVMPSMLAKVWQATVQAARMSVALWFFSCLHCTPEQCCATYYRLEGVLPLSAITRRRCLDAESVTKSASHTLDADMLKMNKPGEGCCCVALDVMRCHFVAVDLSVH